MDFVWSTTVTDYYPVNPRPRWGYGCSSNRSLVEVLEKGVSEYERTLDEFKAHALVLRDIRNEASDCVSEPFWQNIWFSTLDAASLVCFISSRKPKVYLEIGSGHSTQFARYAIRKAGLNTHLLSIDPCPRRGIDELCDEMRRIPLEDCDLDLFRDLGQGDMLFFDGSHRVFTNSDVTVFFTEILPILKPGVLVHLHDIFLPDDYPADWSDRLYSEQYILAAMLLCADANFKVVLPNYFVCTHHFLAAAARELLTIDQKQVVALNYENAAKTPAVSFWLEKR